ncbi:MAG: prepilin-type N-terminal cleavage/methylation domain-containing protein [Armatimonadetes bacterium]|nr:prepilin-type N-terminal cleavage/methylation domain-containing protein [Armatimonadota bacterium]
MRLIHKGMTLVELLVCLSIVSVISAISYPVFKSAMISSKVSAAGQNLHQHYIAISLYQADQDASVTEGMPCQMGLPCLSATNSLDFAVRSLPPSSKNSPCGERIHDGVPTVWWLTYRPYDEDTWLKGLQNLGQNIPLVYDTNCDFPGTETNDIYAMHRGLAVSLGGSLLTKINTGNPNTPRFWGE